MAKAKAKLKSKPVTKAKAKKPAAKAAAKPAPKKVVAKSSKAATKKTPSKAGKAVFAKAKPATAAKAKPTTAAQVTKKSPMKASTSQPQSKVKMIDVSGFVTPLDDRIIVQVLDGEKVTSGGIIIPDTVTGMVGNRKGVILSVGRGHLDKKGRVRPMDVQKGDRIVFPDFTGSKINYQGQDLIILRETDVMGVLD